jgi:ATP-binding cassette subfamily F protein 3
MLLIGASGLAVDYGGRTIFSDAALDIVSGERIGVVGENGAGKSTLLRVLAGAERPSEGTVTLAKGLRIGYLAQEPHFAPDETVYDAVAGAHTELVALGARLAAIEAALAAPTADHAAMGEQLAAYGEAQQRYEALGGYAHEGRVRQILEGLEFTAPMQAQRAESLSGGQKKLVGLARLLVTEPDVLLLDEPDNHLDFEGKAFLERYIGEYPGAVVLISHDRYLLDRVVRRIVEVEDGAVTSWPGGYTAYVEQKEAHLLRLREQYQVQREALRRQEEAMYRLVQWARQNPKFAGRAENMKKQVARKREEMMDRPLLTRRRIRVDFGQHDGSRKVVTATGVTLRAGGSKDPTARALLHDASFAVAFGERVGIVGPNGSGKSTLLKALVGLLPVAQGELRLGATVRAGYYAQEQETLPPEQTPLEWVRQQKALTEQGGISRLRLLLLTYEDMHAPIGKLSGGQRSRLQFERLMLGDYNLLVLDEPTNNVDIASAEVLESALQEFEGTAIIVSHDRYLLDNAVDRILELPGNGTVIEYLGNYTYFLEHRPDATVAPPEVERASQPRRTSPAAGPVAPAPIPPVPASPVARPEAAPRPVRLAVLGMPGTGKRALVTELRALASGEDSALHVAHSLEVEIGTLGAGTGAELAAVARRAEALLLVQDLAGGAADQITALRALLREQGIVAMPHPAPIALRARSKGGLVIEGTDDAAVREALTRWCRVRQITHAEIGVRAVVPLADLELYADAVWQRGGGARARQQAEASGRPPLLMRPAVVVGTRADEFPGFDGGPERALAHLRALAPGFGCVVTSVFDLESLHRLQAAVLTVAGR